MPPCAAPVREPEHAQVPELPERGRPAAGHETPGNAVHAAVQDVHDQQVAEHQDNQHHAGNAHEQPGEQLTVGAARGRALRGARCVECEFWHQWLPNSPRTVRSSMKYTPGTITTT